MRAQKRSDEFRTLAKLGRCVKKHARFTRGDVSKQNGQRSAIAEHLPVPSAAAVVRRPAARCRHCAWRRALAAEPPADVARCETRRRGRPPAPRPSPHPPTTTITPNQSPNTSLRAPASSAPQSPPPYNHNHPQRLFTPKASSRVKFAMKRMLNFTLHFFGRHDGKTLNMKFF